MARPTIANFNGSYIAMPFGANQYFVMNWDNNQRQWFPFDQKLQQEGQPPNEIPRVLPLAALQGPVPGGEIHLHKPRRRGQQQSYKVNFITTDHYIKAFIRGQRTNIPILNKTGGDRIPPCFTRNLNLVYETPDPPGVDQLLRGELWVLRAAAPAPQAQMRPAPAPVPQPLKVVLEPIPRRIAWLIAEAAQKEGEQCGITFEEISPLTATVTTCFHCFDANALGLWFQQATVNGQDRVCPLCRKLCLTTKAYEGDLAMPPNEIEVDGVIEILDNDA